MWELLVSLLCLSTIAAIFLVIALVGDVVADFLMDEYENKERK